MTEIVLAILLSLTPYKLDNETPTERKARLTVVADAIAKASKTPNDAAMLLALGWHESKFAEYVGNDRCEAVKWACDAGKARGYWQSHKLTCPKYWALPKRHPEATQAAAQCAVRRLRGFGVTCSRRGHDAASGSFAGWAGRGCKWSGSAERVTTFRRMQRKMWGRQPKGQ